MTTRMQIIPNMNNSPIICNNLLECFCNEQRTPPIIPNVSVNPIKEKRYEIKTFNIVFMNLRDIDLKISFRYQGIHTIRGTLGSEPLLERLPI